MVSRTTTSAQRLRLCVVKCAPEVVYTGNAEPAVMQPAATCGRFVHSCALMDATVQATARSGITGHVSPPTSAKVRTVQCSTVRLYYSAL